VYAPLSLLQDNFCALSVDRFLNMQQAMLPLLTFACSQSYGDAFTGEEWFRRAPQACACPGYRAPDECTRPAGRSHQRASVRTWHGRGTRALRGHLYMPPAQQEFHHHEEIARSLALVLVIHTLRLAWLNRNRRVLVMYLRMNSDSWHRLEIAEQLQTHVGQQERIQCANLSLLIRAFGRH
jgi:hypothetical protein